jgi:hypothetical protein
MTARPTCGAARALDNESWFGEDARRPRMHRPSSSRRRRTHRGRGGFHVGRRGVTQEGAALEILLILANVGTAVVFFPILGRMSEAGAVG